MAVALVLVLGSGSARPRVAGGISFGYDGEQALEAMSPAGRVNELAAMRRTGVSWVRIDTADPVPFPGLIRSSLAVGMHVLLIVESSDPSAPSIAAVGRMLAQRYGPLGVHAYEILNEPNIQQRNQPFIDPGRDVAILRAAHAAIHAADPAATVVSGGLAPAPDDPGTSLSPATYLRDVLDSAGEAGETPQSLFDGVGLHLYSTPILPRQPASWNPWQSVPLGHPTSSCGEIGPSACLRTILTGHGDGAARLWVTETGAPTGPAGGELAESQRFQAETITQAFALANSASDIGPAVFNFQWRDSAAFDFGLVQADGTPKLAAQAFADAVRNTSAG